MIVFEFVLHFNEAWRAKKVEVQRTTVSSLG